MHKFEEAVFSYIDRYQMIPEGSCIVAGVSGGADSVAMLLVLHSYIRKRTEEGRLASVSLQVVHVEHGMRGESSLGDADFVENLCRELGIACTVRHISMKEEAIRRGMTLEEAGRACRYEIFEEVAQRSGSQRNGPQRSGSQRIKPQGERRCRIAVAHNMDDQAETVLMNLTRGSGLRGLSGIAPVRAEVIRPLLGVRRSMIEGYLHDIGRSWRTDESNAETDFTRNKVRLEMLPWMKREINAGAAEHIAQTADFVREADAYLEREAERLAKSCCVFEREQTTIQTDALLAMEPLMRRYVLRMAIRRAGSDNGLKDVSAEHMAALEELAAKQSGRKLDLPGALRAYRSGGRLVITFREESDPGQDEEVNIDGSGEYRLMGRTFEVEILPADMAEMSQSECTKWLNYDTIQGVLKLRSRRTGDYLVTDAKGGRTKVKKYMIDSKIPAEERGNVILAADGHRVLWIVGYRISEDAKITERTRRMIRISLKDTEEEKWQNISE